MTFELNSFFFPRSVLELIYFRKIYRTPAKISRCCVKLKRLLDEEKYKKKNQVKADSLDYNSAYQDIPWEMSFSNATPLRERNDIEIKSYQSLQMEDLKRIIGQSDLIVTLNLEKEKIEEMDLFFDTNTIFHENSKDENQNYQTSVQRSGDVYVEIIVLICGKSFKKEYLMSQQGLLRCIELRQCVVHVICDYSVSQEVTHFPFNFGSQCMYKEKDEFKDSGTRSIPRSSLSDECQDMLDRISRSKLREVQAQVITFCQRMEAVEIIDSIFQELAVAHMNIQVEKRGLESDNHSGYQETNKRHPKKTAKKEIVLIFGRPFLNQLSQQYFSACFINLLEEGCSLTVITENISLNDSLLISSLSKKLISAGLKELLEKIVDEKLALFVNGDCVLSIRENLRNIIEQDFVGSLNSIGNFIDENCPELLKFFIDLLENYFTESPDCSRDLNLGLDRRRIEQLLPMFEELPVKLSRLFKRSAINSAFQKVHFAEKGVRRFFLEKWNNFHIATLIEEHKVWEYRQMDYIMIPWAHRSLQIFREVFRNLLGLESQGTSKDENSIKRELDRIGEGNWRKLVRENLKNFEKPILRSLIDEDFFFI